MPTRRSRPSPRRAHEGGRAHENDRHPRACRAAKEAIEELERAVTVLGLKGAEVDTGVNWDEPKFLPLFKAAEAMGAVLFFHPQPQHNFLMERTTKYGLFNSLGVIMDDAIAV